MKDEKKANSTPDTVSKYAEFMQDMVDGIDVTKNAKWATETREISTNIRDALVVRLRRMDNDRAGEDKFLDYCNGIKSLLAIYNFGNLDTVEMLAARNAGESEITACRKRREEDKNLIKAGVAKILKHVAAYGYDITPNLDRTTCQEIFGEDDNRVVPITISVTAVFTTLVYFRRAFKRVKLFNKEELVFDGLDLNQLTVETVSDIMYLIYAFAYDQKREDMFTGWGVTLDKEYTKAVTLSDTYAVVDALGRFADAFTKDGDKRDEEFISGVDEYAVSKGRYNALTDRCLESTYKTAFNVYERTKSVYGKSVFYSDCQREGDGIRYTYTKTTYEQIASSSRSSALFNPLYVAMITMYGYNDKEVVIRRFMDSSDLARTYYDKYEVNCPRDEVSLSQYAATREDYGRDFEDEKDLLLTKHEPMSKNYGRSNDVIQGDSSSGEKLSWRSYYRVARIFQKYLETYHPEELMKISDYRDYLNATKDAIDQVQIMYRDFDNHQRLGVVDTDYAMFTSLDVAVTGDDISSIAKLNKANLAINNLRPMLLSSKIMIVNALTKYPQADMDELYVAIKEARFSTVTRRKNAPPERRREWVWNEDSPDMNSTARHCEAITYDYFDYYEKYELSFKAMQAFRDEIGEFVKNRVNAADGSIGSAEDIKAVSSDFGQLKQLVLEITRQNVDLVRAEYQKSLAAKDEEIALAKRKAEDAAAALEQEKEESKIRVSRQMAAVEESYKIGETVRGWIRSEIDAYLSKNLSMAVINILNGNNTKDTFEFGKLYKKDGAVIDADFDMVRETWKSILNDCKGDPEKLDEKIAEYNQVFKKVIALQEILGAASNGLLENDVYKQLGRDYSLSVDERNEKIKSNYGLQKLYGVLPEDDKK